MNEITRIITPCRCGKCIYCEFGGNPPAQIIEKETVCVDCERKDNLIEQMYEAIKFSLIADEVRQAKNVCASSINDACETSRLKRAAALEAAERGE